MSWPTQEQFDAASAAGTTHAQMQIAQGATEARPPLSGEYVDDPTPRSVSRAVGWDPEELIMPHEGDAVDELADAFERGYYDVFAHREDVAS